MACGSGDPIGWIVGESTPARSLLIFERNGYTPRAGDYIVAESSEGCVLGIVETVWAGHRMLPPSVTDPRAVDHIAQWTVQAGGEDLYNRGSVRWLALLEPLLAKGRVVAPKTPVVPGSKIYRADPSSLSRIFSGEGLEKGWIRLGSLASDQNVAFHVNANGLMRHLAILAVTGGGKSNTVCIMAKRIVGELCGTMVIFDMHGEYSKLNLANVTLKVHRPPKLNPLRITIRELYKLVNLPENATRQMRYLRWAWRGAIASYMKMTGKTTTPYQDVVGLAKSLLEFLEQFQGRNTNTSLVNAFRKEDQPREQRIKRIAGALSQYLPSGVDPSIVAEALVDYSLTPPRQVTGDSLEGAIAKLEDLQDYYSDVIDVTAHYNLVDAIPPCTLTVFDLSELEESAADAVVSHYLRRLLQERKQAKVGAGGYPYPVVAVVEEAHVLVPRDASTLTRHWAARIAREGRKFGVGLVLVSQRPKNVDANVLSQMNNKIVLRTVEPEDIRYIQRASEEMSDDIAGLLPTLNPGEAIVLGKMATLPALVKIDECSPEEKPLGGDINVVGQWLQARRAKREVEEELEDLW